jgi:hypothetical protein
VPHVYGDERIVEWLETNGYHPRSPRHGSASCLFLLDDFIEISDAFETAARNGEIVYCEDYTVGSGQSRWNTDLVIGPPREAPDIEDGTGERPIVEAEPEVVWLAVDAKSVMTEHGKARRNRQRDINSFADIMHRHYPGSITGGLLLINAAERFRSPLREEGDITEHKDIDQLVAETVDIFRDIERSGGDISPNVDGVGCVVVDHTNMEDGEPTKLVTESPAPGTDDSVHYRRFVELLASSFESRFLSGDPPDPEALRAAENVQHRLNHEVVELAHLAHTVGTALETGEPSPEQVSELREAADALEETVSRIERDFTDR